MYSMGTSASSGAMVATVVRSTSLNAGRARERGMLREGAGVECVARSMGMEKWEAGWDCTWNMFTRIYKGSRKRLCRGDVR